MYLKGYVYMKLLEHYMVITLQYTGGKLFGFRSSFKNSYSLGPFCESLTMQTEGKEQAKSP